MARLDDMPALMNVAEVCSVIRCSKSRLYELLANGALPARKMGVRTVFRREDVLRFIEALPERPTRVA